VFFRIKKSGHRAYVQVVENKRFDGAVRQSVIANLGRADDLIASGALASLLASGAKFTDQVLLITTLDEDSDGSLSVAAKRIGTLIQQRLQAGTASALEVAQQQSLIDNINATIPPLEFIVAQNRNAIALLIGRAPETVSVRGGSLNALVIPRVTPGLPSELLAQRPDIREAEANLASANANVVVARAQFLPSITLTAEGGYESAVLKTLLRPESALFTLAAGLTQPIFQGGRLLGNLDLQQGHQEELLDAYRKAVISGFSDVETALSNVRLSAERERLQRAVVTSSRQAFDVSEQRFREGTLDLVTVLQTQQTLFTAVDALVQARLAYFQAVLSLYQALGGGWLPKPPMETADAR